MGHYLNPDELAIAFHAARQVDLTTFGLVPDPHAFHQYLHRNRSLVRKADDAGKPVVLTLHRTHLKTGTTDGLGYTAALASGFIREQLVISGQSFTFESVLSDPGKLQDMEAAKDADYRIYLYFVCTESPDINVARVASRVSQGGHDVPEDRIRKRYEQTLRHLYPAVLRSDRAYLFDNSAAKMELVLEADGRNLKSLTHKMPAWVEEYLLVPARAAHI